MGTGARRTDRATYRELAQPNFVALLEETFPELAALPGSPGSRDASS